MKLGNLKVEQVNSFGEFVIDKGEILSNSEIFNLFKNFVNVTQIKQGIVKCEQNGSEFYVFFKNISYLGTPHPNYKKRIQIPNWFLSEYEIYSKKAPVVFMGVYSYKDNAVFVNFEVSNYLKNKAHNSSAHILTDDLKIATLEGYAYRKDVRGNVLFAFNGKSFDIFVNKFITKIDSSTPQMFLEFDRFFQSLPTLWNGIECYKDMISANYSRKFQPEWQSSFQEFMFANGIRSNLINDSIVTSNLNRGLNSIDLDLYFPQTKEYGDLKMHSINSSAILGNKTSTIQKCIENNRSVYYIVFEHDTIFDKHRNYTVTEFWNYTQKKADLRSYAGRMKNSISLRKMVILQINNQNVRYLNDFQTGFINSDGSLRTSKISITKKVMKDFVVYSTIKSQ